MVNLGDPKSSGGEFQKREAALNSLNFTNVQKCSRSLRAHDRVLKQPDLLATKNKLSNTEIYSGTFPQI